MNTKRAKNVGETKEKPPMQPTKQPPIKIRKHRVKGVCVVCSHQNRADFERRWLLEEQTLSQIAKEIGCSISMVHKHMHNHLAGQADKVRKALDSGSLDVLTELEGLYRTCDHFLKEAQSSENWPQAKAFVAEARQVLTVIAEVQGKIQKINLQLNVYSNPQVVVLIDKILTALEPWPQARLEVAKALEVANNKT